MQLNAGASGILGSAISSAHASLVVARRWWAARHVDLFFWIFRCRLRRCAGRVIWAHDWSVSVDNTTLLIAPHDARKSAPARILDVIHGSQGRELVVVSSGHHELSFPPTLQTFAAIPANHQLQYVR